MWFYLNNKATAAHGKCMWFCSSSKWLTWRWWGFGQQLHSGTHHFIFSSSLVLWFGVLSLPSVLDRPILLSVRALGLAAPQQHVVLLSQRVCAIAAHLLGNYEAGGGKLWRLVWCLDLGSLQGVLSLLVPKGIGENTVICFCFFLFLNDMNLYLYWG